MKSSSGAHYPALDHIRCLAIFLVFIWHFLHGQDGTPVSLAFVPALPPFSLLDEGHTGVSLFMALSGYLFAKLLDGRSIRYLPFLANRALRLLPLLVAVTLLEGARRYLIGKSLSDYVIDIAKAPLLPTLPNGGWSITVEAHFYVLLPLILMACRRSALAPLLLIAIAILVRVALYTHVDHIRSLTYFYSEGHIRSVPRGHFCFPLPRICEEPALGHAGCLRRIFGLLLVVRRCRPFFGWVGIRLVALGLDYLADHRSRRLFVRDRLLRHTFLGQQKIKYPTVDHRKSGSISYSIYLLHIFFVFGMSDFIYRHVMTRTASMLHVSGRRSAS